ncbi:MAG: CHASE domain-containing protein [Gammaproteobacteria bacterium]|jgi:signal transduction histidine kinase|nr:CHASE domain-containing protein [Gammaproteobacteria bacterium]
MSDLQPTKQQQKSTMWHFFLGRFIIFLCLLSISIVLFTKASITDQEIEFNRQTSHALNRIQEQLIINDAALSGFASLLQALGPVDLQRVRDYTEGMVAAHGQIYMFEALVGIRPEDQQAFAEDMQEKGLQDYKVYRYASRNNASGKPTKPFNLFNDTPVMFPVFFISPLVEEVRSILGFDMMSAKAMREPLIKGLSTGQTAATLPYNLREGGKGYILYKSVNKLVKASGADAVGTLVAAMLVRTDSMLEAAHLAIPRASITMSYGEQQKLAAKQQPTLLFDVAPVWQLGELTQEYNLGQFGQALKIQITQPIGLYQGQLNQLMVLTLLLLLGFFVFFRTATAKRRSEMQRDSALIDLAQQHDQLEHMVTKRTVDLQRTSDENKRLARQIVRLEEANYHYLARELHDEFGQTLTAIKISAQIVSQSDSSDDVHQHAADIFWRSDNLYESMQNLIQRLRPEALDTFGLKVAIEQCINGFKFAEQGIGVEVDIDNAIDSMDEIYIIASYRITQELLNNAAKYAKASKITVQLHQEPEGVCICVIDNGIGFDQASLEKGYGLNGIAERVKSLGGSIKTSTAVGEGVNTCAKLPAQFAQKE